MQGASRTIATSIALMLLSWAVAPLFGNGTVRTQDNLVRFERPGLTEEYSTSIDGIRQDFVIAERPSGAGGLRVELAVAGARAMETGSGAKLVLEDSGRQIAYEGNSSSARSAQLKVMAASTASTSPRRMGRVVRAAAASPLACRPLRTSHVVTAGRTLMPCSNRLNTEDLLTPPVRARGLMATV